MGIDFLLFAKVKVYFFKELGLSWWLCCFRELSIACGMFDLKNVKLMLDLGCCDDV